MVLHLSPSHGSLVVPSQYFVHIHAYSCTATLGRELRVAPHRMLVAWLH